VLSGSLSDPRGQTLFSVFTGDQTTTYVYGTAAGGITPEIYRNDLLRAEIYPDSDDTTSLGNGTDGIYDRIEWYGGTGSTLDS
jgi:hypothetical protein